MTAEGPGPPSAASDVVEAQGATGIGQGAAYVWSTPVPYFQFDQQGIVFNMWYLAWCDEAYAGYLRQIGAPHDALIAGGHDQHLVHAEVDWIKPLRAGEGDVSVIVDTNRVGTSSFELGFSIVTGHAPGPHIERAQARIVYVNAVGGKSAPLPAMLRTALEAQVRSDEL